MHLKDLIIPPNLVKIIEIQKIINSVTVTTVDETAVQIYEIIKKDFYLSELVNLLVMFANTRPHEINLISELTFRLSLKLPTDFAYDLMEASKGNFTRQMYLRGLNKTEQTIKNIKEDSELSVFFLEEFGTSNALKLKRESPYYKLRSKIEHFDDKSKSDYQECLAFGYPKSSLAYEIKYDYVEKVERRFQRNKNEFSEKITVGLFECDIYDLEPVYIAAYYGSEKVFDFMMKNNFRFDKGINSFAIRGGSFKIIKKCIEINKCMDEMLKTAMEVHRYDIFDWLIDRGAKIDFSVKECAFYSNSLVFLFLENQSSKNDYESALRIASYKGNFSISKECLQKGAFIDHIDETNKPMIADAAEEESIELIDFLLDNGSSIECRGENGMTPLMYAAKSSSYKSIKELIKRGANINAFDDLNQTALYYSALEGDYKSVSLFVSKGAEFQTLNTEGKSPLGVTFFRYPKIAAYLISKCTNNDICKRNNIDFKKICGSDDKLITLIATKIKKLFSPGFINKFINDCENRTLKYALESC